ncbi:helix-turn-helix transcriptional regulator [Streptomyces sp. M2CJ-2]|uniref:helix-turn-helix domain-containing protein n=1 Tax=Streptomyces sp. M2CJ-2 TaxID=2803948 RepID=UPI00192904BB|nr:helix-turn-helix transcriptional regulator [Streptomyces sp. M2CJ-2]MBL3671460.1 helix-turn-helix transcriptional regulator [Streptomyces sp. M2CJ-2]
MLSGLGLDETCGAVYQAVLFSPGGATPDGIAADLRVPVADVCDGLARLRALGLVRPLVEAAGAFRAVSPAVGFAPLIARAEAEASARSRAVVAARAHVEELASRFGTAPHDRGRDFAVLLGEAEAWEAVQQVAEDVKTCVRLFAAAGPAPGLAAETYEPAYRLAVRAVEQGAEVRLIVLDSVRSTPDVLEGVRWMNAKGVTVRSVPTLPAWMFVVDDSYTLMALDPADHRAGALTFRAPGPMAAARDLFDRRWAAGCCLSEDPEPADERPTAQQNEVLRMLAEGAKDEAVARCMSVSTRTVRRLIADIGERLGAESRFQIAVRATERGWLS